jgi:hypothetical protein
VTQVLSVRALNRATLGRQGLLARSDLDPVTAVERFGGLQAQEAASPAIALWSRLEAFEPEALRTAIAARRIVKASLMRSTLHLVSAADYGPFFAALHPMLRAIRPGLLRGLALDDLPIADLVEATLAFATEPRSNAQLRQHLSALVPDDTDGTTWLRVRRHAAMVLAPEEGGGWSFGRRPRFVASRSWLRDWSPVEDEAAATAHLVKRYLAAFGPARPADVTAWCGLTATRVRGALAAMEPLARYRDERGRELVDLADMPTPPPDENADAPVRLLPMWDSVLLAHADRTRVIADEHRKAVIAGNGDVAPTFLVDGFVAGMWWAEHHGRIVFEPFRRLARSTRSALESEAERLAAFVASCEPGVFGRYRTSRARRPSTT